jgi:hypothetical protein
VEHYILLKHSLSRIDPLFNPSTLSKPPSVKPTVVATSLLTSSNEPAPKSHMGGTMMLVEGAYKGKAFKLWVDQANRLAIPVRKD